MKAKYLFILLILCFEARANSDLDDQLFDATKNGIYSNILR